MIPTIDSTFRFVNRNLRSGYLAQKMSKAAVNVDNANMFEKLMIMANQCKGEHFNNAVTAVGTAGVAPIFIIHNPLAKEDKATKQYTAARQPISAIITLAAQVPIMSYYNDLVDKMATNYHLDRCDLSAAPPRSCLKSGIEHEYSKILRDDPSLLQVLKKGEIKDLIYQKLKDNAFHDELTKIRRSVFNGTEPDYLKKCLLDDGKVKIDYLLAPADFEKAEQELLIDYLQKNQGLNINDKGAFEFIDKNGKAEKIDIKSLSELKKNKKFAKYLKDNNITVDFQELSQHASKDRITELAKMNVEYEMFHSAKIKFKSAQLYTKAKQELAEYMRQLSIDGIKGEEANQKILAKEKELFDKLLNTAKNILNNAPDTVQNGSMELNKAEAQALVDKISFKVSRFNCDDALSVAEKEIQKHKRKIYDCFKFETKINYLKTEGRDTFDHTLRDVQLKKWLKARINNAEKVLPDFKQKSGLVVGLAILPFTCGLLNWAYPRIMEEWFPNLAHSKKANNQQKEVK